MAIAFILRHGDHVRNALTAQGRVEAAAAAATIRACTTDHVQRRLPYRVWTSQQPRAFLFGDRVCSGIECPTAIIQWTPLNPAEEFEEVPRQRNLVLVADMLRRALQPGSSHIPILVTHSPNIAALLRAFEAPDPVEIPTGSVILFASGPNGRVAATFPPIAQATAP